MDTGLTERAALVADTSTSFDAPLLIIPSAAHIPTLLPDGIHFGLDEAEYHAQPRFSTSGIKQMKQSAMDFWARSFMNAEKADADDEPTKAMSMGTAYHKRILEGRDAFYQRYAAAVDPAAFPTALRTVEEIKVAITELGAKPIGKRKEDWADQLRILDPSVELWSDIVARHAREWAGYEFLAPELINRIEIAAAMIERHPQLSKVFSGGYSEVSLFWTCAKTGVPMKARVDYLKLKLIADLKTVSNPNGKPFDAACRDAIAGRGYYIQAPVYQEGLAAVKALLLAHGPKVVFGDCDIEWVEKLALAPEPQFMFVFQQTGIAPVARGFGFPSSLTVSEIGADIALASKRRFAEFLQRNGTAWWVDDAEVRDLDTSEFPAWIGMD